MVGVSITLVATATMSLIGFLLALEVAGVGFVSGFQGAIRSVLQLAPAKHRASVLSVIYVVSHLALSLPAIIAGVVVVGTGSLELTARAYGIAVFALAALAFAGLARRGQAENRLGDCCWSAGGAARRGLPVHGLKRPPSTV